MNKKEEELRKSIGKKIKLARSKEELTQEDLAEKLSLSPRYISQLERGIAFGSATTIIGLCNSLNISSDFLFEDLIKNKNSKKVSDVMSQSFLENYMKLNNYNRIIIDALANQPIKLQKATENRNKEA